MTTEGAGRIWPGAGHGLVAELRRSAGRLALVAGEGAERVVNAFADVLGVCPTSVGWVVTGHAKPPAPEAVTRLLAGAEILVDLDVLFWRPGLGLDPIGLLRQLGRRAGRSPIAWWPGDVRAGMASYSVTARRDHYTAALDDAIVLRPRPTTFPDEVPYEIERY